MPNWGLTTEQLALRPSPWGLDPELLAPCKTITDPVHGDIYLNRLEVLLLDSPPMQRLRRVRQLGMTQLVYPGATHSRWSHSVGTLRAAQDLLDAVWNSRNNPHSDHELGNLLDEWNKAGTLEHNFAEATVLARLGGLLHDLCHIPVGHTIEDDLRILDPHDANVRRFEALWADLDPVARDAIDAAPDLKAELRVLIISKDKHARRFQSQQRYPFVGDIVGNTICADLIDYLQRDHHNSGLPLALGHRFMDSFFVVGESHPHFPKKMVISIQRLGRRRADIVTELVKYLRYRYELTERVLTHHAKSAADAMLGKMLELWYDDLCDEIADGRRAGSRPSRRMRLVGTERLPEVSPNVPKKVREKAKNTMESEFLRRSDDGILEYVRDRGGSRATKRSLAAAELAQDLLDRRLFKILGHAASAQDRAVAHAVFDKFAKDSSSRRALESAAADFAELAAGWKVVAWVPSPEMRLKVAEVLVHTGDQYVAPLSAVEVASQQIVEQHKNLWAVTVYAPRETTLEQGAAVLSFLGDRMGLRFVRPSGRAVWSVDQAAVDALITRHPEAAAHREALLNLAPAAKDSTRATFRALVQQYEATARQNGYISGTDSTTIV